ncbi:MAG TPA: T9SS type A sorting domain-containing protein [Candidatus Kapabacteria bacterium]|nr:T9SS type A sorting domain-containing protein [Candidatus Kapabacteria bacterium]
MKKYLPLLVLFAVSFANRSFAQTQPKVLAELFSNINCGNCSGPDEQYYGYASQHPELGVEIISYHNEITDPYDLFYNPSHKPPNSNPNPSVAARESLYNIQVDPSGLIDGIPASQTQWATTTQTYAQTPLTPINVTATKDAGGLIHITFIATGPSSGSSIAFVAIKESHIVYDNSEAYGNPPSGYWDNIFRVMLPGPTGSTPLAANETRSFDVTYDPSQHPTWNLTYMDAVVFVQDVAGNATSGFDVESIGDVSLAQFSAVASANVAPLARLLISGNPVINQAHIGFELVEAASVHITLFDMLGREVRTLAEGMMPAGQSSIEMNAASLPSGCYLARMIVNGEQADQQKLVVE